MWLGGGVLAAAEEGPLRCSTVWAGNHAPPASGSWGERKESMRANRSSRRLTSVVAAAALISAMALAVPAIATAQQTDPTDVEYGTPVFNVEAGGGPGSAGGGGDPTGDVSNAGSLPFTGLDLAAIAAIGAGLLGAGFVIRRAATPRRQL